MDIINKKLKDLIPYINNPRFNEAAIDKVASSIAEFGFKVPIIIDKNNIIVTGHTRYKASEKLGLEEVPCIIADDLSEAQIKAFRIADNKVAEYSEWDNDLLNIELQELNDLDFNLDLTGFNNFDFLEKESTKKFINQEINIEEFADENFKHECPKNKIKYITGMCVPPIMMARIAIEIEKQILGGENND